VTPNSRFGLGGALVGLALIGPAAPAQDLSRFEYTHPAMGTEFRIVLYATDSVRGAMAAGSAFARLRTLEDVLSDYDPDSEASMLAATSGSGRWVRVSDDLWAALDTSGRLSEKTKGAFDVTVGPIARLWRWADRRGTLPNADRIARASAAVGWRYVHRDAATRRVRLAVPGMRLDFGGIGKGIAADEMLRVLDSLGIRSALVDAGGDIVVSKAPPGEAGWCIQLPGVRDGSLSDKTITVSEAAVATSGDQFRWFEVDGVRYSHLIDPRDGIGVTVRRLVTVIAPTGSLADALASAISVDPDLAAWAWPETTVQVLEMDDRGWRQKRQERQERQ